MQENQCNQEVHKRDLRCLWYFTLPRLVEECLTLADVTRQVFTKRRYVIPILRRVNFPPKMPRSQLASRWKPEVTPSKEKAECIRLSISISFIMTLVPACQDPREIGHFSRGKGKGGHTST